MGWWTVLKRTALVMLAVFALIQLVPYGRDHDAPPVEVELDWPDAGTEALARGACYDCHSRETEWPAYSWVAPMSWLVTRDVETGREALDLSTVEGLDDLDDAADEILDGAMPPRQYQLAHPDARLSAEERRRLAAAFEQLEAQADRAEDRSDDDRSEGGSGPG